jgi:RNA polymerase sigma-70 factor
MSCLRDSVAREMPRLLEGYRAAWSPHNSAVPDWEALESTIETLCARGRAAHPELTLEEATFAKHLARCRAPLASVAGQLHAEDLWLACAALARDERAVARLGDQYSPVVWRYARHIKLTPAALDDLSQSLWAALLFGEPPKAPGLALYSGFGALAGFVGITAQRMALRKLQAESAAMRVAERAAAETRLVAGDPELDVIRQRYRAEFESAVRTALESLDDRQRMILRMRVVDGLTCERIAKGYGVGQATISRWLERMREQVRRDTLRLLRERVPLTESDFGSLAALVASQLDLSISTLFDGRPARG